MRQLHPFFSLPRVDYQNTEGLEVRCASLQALREVRQAISAIIVPQFTMDAPAPGLRNDVRSWLLRGGCIKR